jgi:hypothetical protein
MKVILIILLFSTSLFADDITSLNMEGANFYEMISSQLKDKPTINEFQARSICNELRKSYRKALREEQDKTSEKYLELKRQSEILFFIGGIMERNSQKSLYDFFLMFIKDHGIKLELGIDHVRIFEEFFIYLKQLNHLYASMSVDDLCEAFENFVCSHQDYGKIFNQGMFVSWRKNTLRARKNAGGYQTFGWLRSGSYAWKTGLLTCAAALALTAWSATEFLNSRNPAREPMPKNKISAVEEPKISVTPDEKEMTLDEYLEKRGKELKRPLPEGAKPNRTKNDF